MPAVAAAAERRTARFPQASLALATCASVSLVAVAAVAVALGFVDSGLSGQIARLARRSQSLEQRVADIEAENDYLFDEKAEAVPQRITDPRPRPDFCLESADPGDCASRVSRWHFLPAAGDCARFEWTGCGGNDNNFLTRTQCRAACGGAAAGTDAKSKDDDDDHAFFSAESCSLAPDAGPCQARIPRLYFHPPSAQCLPFSYGGCAGNANNFVTEDECLERCGGGGRTAFGTAAEDTRSSSSDVCGLPADPGTRCGEAEVRYYYDGTRCHHFLYGGCGGNDNNFVSVAKCRSRCEEHLGQRHLG